MLRILCNLKVRQKLFILLIIGLLIIISSSVTGSLWLVSQSSQPINLLQPLANLHKEKQQDPLLWQNYLNEHQTDFHISQLALYSATGDLISSSNTDAPQNLFVNDGKLNGHLLLISSSGLLLLKAQPRWWATLDSLGFLVFSVLLIFGIVFIYVCLLLLDYLITRPIRMMNNTMSEISQSGDFSIRAHKYYHDEIGALADNFNDMLSIIDTHSKQTSAESQKAQTAKLRAIELSKKMHEMNENLTNEVKYRAKIEQAISELQQYLNNIIESMPSAIIAVDADLHIIQCNSNAQELFSLDSQNILHASLPDICLHLREYIEPIRYSVNDQQLLKIERITLPSPESLKLYDLIIYPLKNSQKPGAVIRIDDVSQRVRMEEMLVQNEKMMSLGGLAAGMAHEINNPLGAIIHTLQNINRRLDPHIAKNIDTALAVGTDIGSVRAYLSERDIFAFFDNIREAGERASLIVSNMLQFSRQSHKDLHPQDIHQIIERAISIARNDYNMTTGYDFKRIDLFKDFEFHLPQVPCIPSEIEQVVINILKNAAQALTDYESNKAFDPDWFARIEIHTYLEHGQAVIEIADNGPGMSDETRKHIFEPFFTTKDVGAGTGLGLSVSYFIITSHHNGAMQVSSKPGEGSVFTLYLPLQSNS